MGKYLAATALVAAVLASGGALAQAKWDMPTGYPATNYHTVNAQKFVDAVKKASGDKLSMQIHPGGSLFKATEIKRAVQTGQAQIGEVLMVNLQNEDAIFGADGVPFLATSFAAAKKLYDAQRPVLEKKLASQGIVLLYTVPWPPQGLYAKKPIESVKDLEGLKWRAYSPQTARIGELVKAQPVTVQQAELQQALATGKVESFMTSGATGVDEKVWEHLTHYYDLQAWLPKNMVIANKDAFDKLDKATQDVVRAEAKKAEDAGWAEAERLTKGFLDTLAKNGMKVQPPGPELAKELNALGEPMVKEWLAKAGPDGQTIVDAYRK